MIKFKLSFSLNLQSFYNNSKSSGIDISFHSNNVRSLLNYKLIINLFKKYCCCCKISLFFIFFYCRLEKFEMMHQQRSLVNTLCFTCIFLGFFYYYCNQLTFDLILFKFKQYILVIYQIDVTIEYFILSFTYKQILEKHGYEMQKANLII